MQSTILNKIIQNWKQIITDSTSLKPFTIYSHKEASPYQYDKEHNVLYISIRDDKWNKEYERFNLQQIQNAIRKATTLDVTCEYIKYKVIDINIAWLKESIDFALNSFTHMTQKDFQDLSKKRTNEDFFIDTVRGKLAEYVFQKFYLDREKNYTFEIDNKIYESIMETDNGNDLQIISNVVNSNEKYFNNLKVDIKASKEGSEWLLIEKKKSYSDIYVFVKIRFENEKFLSKGTIKIKYIKNEQYRKQLSADLLSIFNCNIHKYYGFVAGYAFYSDFIDPNTNKPWFPFKKYHGLPEVYEVPKIFIQDPIKLAKIIEDYHRKLDKKLKSLKAEMNYGMPARYLRKSSSEWENFFQKINSVKIPANSTILDNQYPRLMSDRSEAAVSQRNAIITNAFIAPIVPVRDLPDWELPDDDLPVGDSPDDDLPDWELPDGDLPAGNSPDGDLPDWELPDGDLPAGNSPDGDLPAGNSPDGDLPDWELPDDDLPE